MPTPYIKPGVTVDEIVTPAFSTAVGEPTSIGIIGPSRGYETHTEITTLADNQSYTLGATNPDVNTIKVYDASNPNLAPFSSEDGSGYTIDSTDLASDGVVRIRRTMETDVVNGETVVAYYENKPSSVASQANSHSDRIQLNGIERSALLTPTADLDETTVVVQKAGIIDDDDYNLGGSAGSPTITRDASATVLRRFQHIWVDYTNSATTERIEDHAVQLNWSTTDQAVALPANATEVVVKNAPGATGVATTYTGGTTLNDDGYYEDGDYGLYGTNTSATIGRSAGTTLMGGVNNRLQVRIVYDATPATYWLPTQVFSLSDAEDKYGDALNADGTINSPLSFGALIAFENGATNIVLQALFGVTQSTVTLPTGAVSDWENTLLSMRNVEGVNVLVPLVATGGLTTDDNRVISIFQEVRKHIAYMNSYDQFITALLGEDSTVGGYASKEVRRSHAKTLSGTVEREQMALISPASFSYANPVSGGNSNVGGQYAACALAGMMSSRPVQETLTRKQLVGVNGVNEVLVERDKNQDAENGLLVIEARGGAIRVRHALTVANANDNSSTAQRELNVVRAKHYMMESVRDVLDTQVVGQIPADNNAAFIVQNVVTGVLDGLVTDGVIVEYANVQARRLTNDPSKIEVRFSYVPSFPLNYIAVKFSINTQSGEIIADVATQGV